MPAKTRIASVNRSLVPAVAGRLRIDAHVLLQRRDQVRHDLQRDHDLGADRRADDVIRFGRLMSFSESGSTSQKARVKSNGVCEMAQKFA